MTISSSEHAVELLPSAAELDDSAVGLLAAEQAQRSGRFRASLRSTAIGLVSIVVWLSAWELASRYELDFFFRFENIPAPSEVALAVGELVQTPKFAAHVGSSITRIFIGFSIAALLAVTLGLLIGRFRLVARSLLPPLEVIRPIPAVAWIPIAILLFASAEQSMVFITFIGAFFPILLSTVHGVEALDRRLVFASLSLGAGPLDVFWEVILPGAMPSIVTGLSIGMGTSWFSLVTAEMISGQYGIGYYTWEAYTLQKYPSIVLGMIAIGVLGMGSSFLVRVVGQRLMPWFKPAGSAA
ncbi:MAG TPA: ABC transporter permease [Polyangiaceae bacterium]|nr:ABC transporter permease [Polyangiaceae bacterium]